jgi:uncharacterized protein (DUF2252 family)
MSRSERTAFGKRLRDRVMRSDQARWQVGERDVRARLRAAEVGRQPELLAFKYAKMATAPFAFLRGGAAVMAPDLAAQPTTGYTVQICGDAHVRNLGAYSAADGSIAFDLNDFDETCRGPWEWDLRRLAISLVLVGRESRCGERVCRDAVIAMVAAWRETMHELAELTFVELARYHVTRFTADGPVGRTLAKAARMTPVVARDKLTIPDVQGRPRFLDYRVSDAVAQQVIASLAPYRDTLGAGRQQVVDSYLPYDVAIKIAGTGSLGLRNYVVLCIGNGDDDPLILQVKQAVPSCYTVLGLVEPDPRSAEHHGRRVAEGQHRMQTHVDPFLGWTTIEGVPFVVRALADHQASIDLSDLGRSALVEYGRVCGETFAKAHARTADPAVLDGYAGIGANLDRALGELAIVAADQVTADWEILLAAITKGEIIAEARA